MDTFCWQRPASATRGKLLGAGGAAAENAPFFSSDLFVCDVAYWHCSSSDGLACAHLTASFGSLSLALLCLFGACCLCGRLPEIGTQGDFRTRKISGCSDLLNLTLNKQAVAQRLYLARWLLDTKSSGKMWLYECKIAWLTCWCNCWLGY